MSDETTVTKPAAAELGNPDQNSRQSPSRDSTKLTALLVSIAALIVSGSSMYQSYLNRVYSQETNRAVLTAAPGEGLFLPSRGWLITTSKISNVGKMTALNVIESGIKATAGVFEDDCFLVAGHSDTKAKPKTVLPGANEHLSYIIQVNERCKQDFLKSNPLPSVTIESTVTYTDRAHTKGEQDLSVQVTNPRLNTSTKTEKQ